MNRSLPTVRFPTERLWKAFGEAHKSIYLGSSGRVGSRLAWIPMLLLSTQGRRSGLVRTMPLAYMPDPDEQETYVIAASNGGSEKPPAWWLNLQAHDLAMVQAGRESFLARAERAPGERSDALWKLLRGRIPPYRLYERIDREIPIVLLRRLPPIGSNRHASRAGGPKARASILPGEPA